MEFIWILEFGYWKLWFVFQMKKILFVCTGNSCRSVMAEALFRKITSSRAGQFYVTSAGTGALDGFPASFETVLVMQEEEGIDVSDHRSQQLTAELVRDADRIFVMERVHKDWVLQMVPEAKNRVSLLTEYASAGRGGLTDIDIPDPIRMSDHFYKNVLSVIRDCVKKIAESL